MVKRVWPQALLLIGLLLLLQTVGDDAQAILRFSRQALDEGAWWRLLTAHFVHLGWIHTILNILGVLMCCALAPQLFDYRLWLKLVCLALGVSLSLWCWSPEITVYSGMSGVLYGLLVLGLWPQARRKDRLAALALAMTAGWMLWQLAVGPSTTEEQWIGGRIAAIAHLYGFGTGLTMMLVGMVCRRISSG
ncbi:rhombosortase [Pollutimonas harenae]|uniref:Rhombosortase n=1 Tax=Pollutimonas harenae TaxID=657015 RepID=A0A853H4B0_9BURK|nr:rhombosortase [Pollutimonas harenae]NYT86015.1 rhombosortase [Pollutimonas harenae]TEA71063.1 rhombosortase [Pollutimonas harenae]